MHSNISEYRRLLLWISPVLSLALFIFVSIATAKGGEALHPWEYVAGAGASQYSWENHPLKFLYFGFNDLFSVFRFVDNNAVLLDSAPEAAMRAHPDAYLLVTHSDLLFIICFGLFGLTDTVLSLLFGALEKSDDDIFHTNGFWADILLESPFTTVSVYLLSNVTAWVSAFLGFRLTLLLAPLMPEQGIGRFLFLLVFLFIFGMPFIRSLVRCKSYMLMLELFAGIPLIGWLLMIAGILLLEGVVLKLLEGTADTILGKLLSVRPLITPASVLAVSQFVAALILTILLTI